VKTTLANVSTTTEPARHTPERVLSTIAATARLDGLTAPRWISFDEPRKGEPLAVLSLTWKSLDAVRPWLAFFAAEPLKAYRRDDGTAHYSAWADYHGWNVALNAVDAATCTCAAERVHMIGCASVDEPTVEVPTEFAKGVTHLSAGAKRGSVCQRFEFGRDSFTDRAEWVTCVPCGAAGAAEHLADHLAFAGHLARVAPEVLNPDAPIPYVPVAMPTGVAANRAECARLDGETAHHGLVDAIAATLDLDHGLASILGAEDPPDPPVHLVGAEQIVVCGRTDEGLTLDPEATTCVDCNRRAILDALATGPSRLSRFRLDAIYSAVRDGVVIAGDPDSDDPTTFQLPAAHCVPADVHPRGHEPTWRSNHQPTDRDARIVDVLTIDPELADEGRGGAGIERIAGASPAAEVEAFNAAWPVGTVVDYWRGAYEGEPSDRGATRTPAQVLSGHTAVVWIEGCSGCIALSHVRPTPYASDQYTFAEAPDRLRTVRDDVTFAGIVEASS
jgi:hypothetical protein